MKLVPAATFGSLPEASIAFSSLASAGFNPVAAAVVVTWIVVAAASLLRR
jgi:hypothetical protein